MTSTLTLEEVHNHLKVLLASQSPHTPTTITFIRVNTVSNPRVVELESLDNRQVELAEAEAQIEHLQEEVRTLKQEIADLQ